MTIALQDSNFRRLISSILKELHFQDGAQQNKGLKLARWSTRQKPLFLKTAWFSWTSVKAHLITLRGKKTWRLFVVHVADGSRGPSLSEETCVYAPKLEPSEL